MSQLTNFEATDSWLARCKKLLLTERKAAQLPEPTSDNQRFSLDFVKDLQIKIDDNMMPLRENNSQIKKIENTKNMDIEKNKEMWFHVETEKESVIIGKKLEERNTTFKRCNDTVLEIAERPQLDAVSDESFEALEKMCNKTGSDPNNTLFQYLHSDNKELFVANEKKRSLEAVDSKHAFETVQSNEKPAEEVSALQILLNELRVEDQRQNENISPFNTDDITQLEDIEAPSKFWDNTVMGETIIQTSPVKMVGLLRPSTILEECGDESTCSDVSSQISFKSILKGTISEASSSCYDTAHDSTATSSLANAAAVQKEKYGLLTTNKFKFLCEGANLVPKIVVTTDNSDTHTLPLHLDPTEEFPSDDKSINLIELEDTFGPLHNSPHSSILEQFKDEQNGTNDLDKDISNVGLEYDSENSVIEVESDDDADNHVTNLLESSSEKDANLLCATLEDKTINSNNFEDSGEKSLHFNDTLEEVEYMMKKGLEYMAAAAADYEKKSGETFADTPNTSVHLLKGRENTYILSPKRYRIESPILDKKKSLYYTPSAEDKPVTPSIAKSKEKDRFGLDMKPIPKLDIFKKPTLSGTRQKEITKKQFSHIVSPIGTYMKKTATTPLMTTFKNKSRNPDIFNSTAFRELRYESTYTKPLLSEGESHSPANIPGIPAVECSLPKKAYISSEFKQIVDERTPFTIPGGKSIQKYLESAMVPAVVRHEGKLKVSGCTGATPKQAINDYSVADGSYTSQNPRNRDASLADLSLMSGDVSVYTIMDAQKF